MTNKEIILTVGKKKEYFRMQSDGQVDCYTGDMFNKWKKIGTVKSLDDAIALCKASASGTVMSVDLK